jgi:predicted alpha-1,2-mannosidase
MAFISVLAFKYHRIVSAQPGRLQTGMQPGALGRSVNPFIGTGGFPWVCGNNFPGAMVPLGMVRLGPETASLLISKRTLNTSGYYYGDERVLGFSHTRLNGTGAVDGGHFLVMPALEPIQPKLLRQGSFEKFSHSEELAFPGYYALRLRDSGTLAELTSTARVGVHRYTFHRGTSPHLRIDVSHALGNGRSRNARVQILPEANEVEGAVHTFGSFSSRYGGIKVFFIARFDQPFGSFAVWRGQEVMASGKSTEGDKVGVDIGFGAASAPATVILKLAISYVSLANARANLDSEAGDKNFDVIVREAQQAWEQKLSLVKVQGGTEAEKRIFYTALYRVFQMPTLFNDQNGQYLGFDRQIHTAAGHRYFTDMSIWDTFRTVHPLYTLIAPVEQREFLVSLVKMAEQGGWLPRWPSGHGYSNSMLGTPADILIAECWLKGIRDFDVETAYEAMRRTALAPTPPGSAFSGREGVDLYLKHNYCPADLMNKTVSRTFEYCWADSAIARLAEGLGKTNDAALFREHSVFYRNLWNPATQYFQPRNSAGQFVEPFKPLLLTYFDRKGKLTKDYVEGSALQWRWGAPFDGEALVSLFRSREYFVDELNAFFARSSPAMGAWNPGPFYWQGNQPDIHAAYLFNDAGRPDLTQKWVRWILENKYGTGYDGLDGNDDGGTLSAWYVLSALGIYPVAGTDRYQLAAPLFQKAEVQMGTNTLTIIAENFALQNRYAQNVTLNGSPLNRFWIRHSEIANGGELRFTMQAEPGKP